MGVGGHDLTRRSAGRRSPGGSGPLVGRTEEQTALRQLLDGARAGLSGVLVVSGEAGVGKTSLLDDVAAEADGFVVVRVVGVESEQEMPFAALHRVATALQFPLAELAAPQRAALEAAFGLRLGNPPAALMVGLASLSLIAQRAAVDPVMLIVDDAHWVDAPSIAAFGFMARRLLADPVVLLIGTRPVSRFPTGLEDLPVLEISGLDPVAARELIEPFQLPAAAADRLIDETDGNPLALVELAGEEGSRRLPRSDAPTRLPLTPRLRSRFIRQTRALPESTQRFLLLAAAEPGCEVDVTLRAATAIGVGLEASTPAEVEGLISITDRVEFRHPLIRAAVYESASEAERRMAHRTIAEAFDPELEPDRRAWHRALAAVAPDDQVAEALEGSAARARARAGFGTESLWLERAAALTSEPERRARRLIDAAEAAGAAGDGSRAHRLLQAAGSLAGSPELRARARRAYGTGLVFLGRRGEVGGILADAARQLEPLDVRAARDTWLEAINQCAVADVECRGSTLADIARGARAAPVSDPPTLADQLSAAFVARILDPPGQACAALRTVLDAMVAGRDLDPIRRHIAFFGSMAPIELWDYEARRTIMERMESLERNSPSPTPALYVVISNLAELAWQRGDAATADGYYLEAWEMATSQTQHPQFKGADAMWLSWQGIEGPARAAANDLMAIAERVQAGLITMQARAGLVVLENAHGRYAAALAHCRPMFETDCIPYGTIILPELIEAAVRTEDLETASAAFERMSARALTSGTASALGLHAQCAALLAAPDDADDLFREAISRLEATPVKVQLARAHLLYGEWLRRRRRRREARRELRIALDQLTSARCLAFAERARTELLATGEHVRGRAVETVDELTPREAQIARLAAARATNGEIAAQLFLSESTVAYHLRKVFRKLEVSSRRELRDALSATGLS